MKKYKIYNLSINFNSLETIKELENLLNDNWTIERCDMMNLSTSSSGLYFGALIYVLSKIENTL